MTPRELAESLEGLDAAERYRRILEFLVRWQEGYGVAYSDGERGRARQVAEANGYFWCPCLLCGRWRGGHEPHGGFVPLTVNTGHCCCDAPECVAEAGRLNELYPNGINGPDAVVEGR